MVKLIASSPAEDLCPLNIGTCQLTEVVTEAVTWVAQLSGADLGLPGPGQVLEADGRRLLWFGADQALILGPPLPEADSMAMADQSDAWVTLRLEGPDARDVLARLTPLDLRPSVFAPGQTARTLLGHMSASLTPVGENAFEIMVFRSMTATAVHEIERAMRGVSARA